MKKKISQFMIKNPVVMSADSSLREVMKEMESKQVSHMIIVGTSRELVGIISKSDLLRKLNQILLQTAGSTYSKIQMNNIKASEVMTGNPIVLAPDDAIEYAVELLLQKQFHCLPVMEANKAVGVVSFLDLLQAYYDDGH